MQFAVEVSRALYQTMSIIIRVKPLVRLNIRHKNSGSYTMWTIVSPIWPPGYGTCVQITNGSINGEQLVCPLGHNHTVINYQSPTYRSQPTFEDEIIYSSAFGMCFVSLTLWPWK